MNTTALAPIPVNINITLVAPPEIRVENLDISNQTSHHMISYVPPEFSEQNSNNANIPTPTCHGFRNQHVHEIEKDGNRIIQTFTETAAGSGIYKLEEQTDSLICETDSEKDDEEDEKSTEIDFNTPEIFRNLKPGPMGSIKKLARSGVLAKGVHKPTSKKTEIRKKREYSYTTYSKKVTTATRIKATVVKTLRRTQTPESDYSDSNSDDEKLIVNTTSPQASMYEEDTRAPDDVEQHY